MATIALPHLGTSRPTRRRARRLSAVPPLPARRTAKASVHLTRRGRLLVLLLLALTLLAVVSVGRVALSAEGTGAAPAPRATVVQPGDTLWSVSRRVAPEHDPRQVILALQQLNGLSGGEIRPGQVLLLPRR